MSVDKNLFPYDLAIVAILKNEGTYLKEWLDYHLLAGVSHFYLYDNDSTDNFDTVINPYVAAGLVTSKRIHGKSAQFAAYDDAVQSYRFACRLMAFIDLDEFIFPRTNQSIVEVVDDIFLHNADAAALAVNWQLYGSNGHDKADLSRGVLERFTRRAPIDWVVPIPNRDIPGGNAQIKTIANPRKIAFFTSAHFPIYFENCYAVNERGGRVDSYCNEPVTADKIALNHYNVKSREEFAAKLNKGRADKDANYFNAEWFELYDRNEVFDDGILTYRNARAENFSLETDEHRLNRLTDALTKTLAAYANDTPPADKLETALTCRATSSYLRGKLPDNERMKIFEEASLAAVLKSLDGLTIADARLLISELPNLLSLPYQTVEELRGASMQVISRLMDFMRANEFWKDFADFDYLQRLLKIFKE